MRRSGEGVLKPILYHSQRFHDASGLLIARVVVRYELFSHMPAFTYSWEVMAEYVKIYVSTSLVFIR
jgi:hypothetical protein